MNPSIRKKEHYSHQRFYRPTAGTGLLTHTEGLGVLILLKKYAKLQVSIYGIEHGKKNR